MHNTMIINELNLSDRFFYECYLSDVKFFSLYEVWESLSPGTPLYLTRDTTFSSNPMAVAVVFKKDKTYKVLGHLPKSEKSEDIANILDMGWDDDGKFFSCFVKHKDFKDSDYQLQLLIRLKNKKS